VTRARVELLLWAAAVLVALVGWRAWREAVPAGEAAAATPLGAPADLRPWSRPLLQDAATILAARDPFRLDRRPADVRFTATLPGVNAQGPAPPPPPPPPERPPLVFAGVIGPPWEALLEGVPGREGAVLVREGDRLGNLRVRIVRPDLLVVQSPDTVWRLRLKTSWQ
jgi:hypothetical protein